MAGPGAFWSWFMALAASWHLWVWSDLRRRCHAAMQMPCRCHALCLHLGILVDFYYEKRYSPWYLLDKHMWKYDPFWIFICIRLHKEMAQRLKTAASLVVGNRDNTFVDHTIRFTDRISSDFSSQEFRFSSELPLCWFMEDCQLGDQNLKKGGQTSKNTEPFSKTKTESFVDTAPEDCKRLRALGRAGQSCEVWVLIVSTFNPCQYYSCAIWSTSSTTWKFWKESLIPVSISVVPIKSI